jgi:hypothetical protein
MTRSDDVEMVSGPERNKARGAEVPRWWFLLMLEQVEKAREAGMSLAKLGAALARAIGREKAWDHGRLSRVLADEKGITDEMVEAFVTYFDLPRPVYYPRDQREAMLIKAATDRERKPRHRSDLFLLDAALDDVSADSGKKPLK